MVLRRSRILRGCGAIARACARVRGPCFSAGDLSSGTLNRTDLLSGLDAALDPASEK